MLWRKTKTKLGEFGRWIVESDLQAKPTVQRLLLRSARLFYYLVLDMRTNRCVERAATLAFVTILSLIPLSILFFSFAGSIGVGDTIIEYVQRNVLPNLAPDFKEKLQEILRENISKDAIRKSFTGLVNFLAMLSLIPTAVAILSTAERSFNLIWRVRRQRSQLQRFTIFWVVLTISPSLLVASTWLADVDLNLTDWSASDAVEVESFDVEVGTPAAVTPTVPELPGSEEPAAQSSRFADTTPSPAASVMTDSSGADESGSSWTRRLGALFIGFVAFTVLFFYLPFTSVRVPSATLGGLVAVLLFVGAKSSFYLYVARTNTLYGNLAIIPLFLIWTYLVWLIVLIGTELAYVHQNFSDFEDESVSRRRQPALFAVGMLFTEGLVRAFMAGSQPPTVREFSSQHRVDRGTVDQAAGLLTKAGILVADAARSGAFLLAKAPEKVPIEEFVKTLGTANPTPLEGGAQLGGSGRGSTTATLLDAASSAYTTALNQKTLLDLASPTTLTAADSATTPEWERRSAAAVTDAPPADS